MHIVGHETLRRPRPAGEAEPGAGDGLGGIHQAIECYEQRLIMASGDRGRACDGTHKLATGAAAEKSDDRARAAELMQISMDDKRAI